MQENWFKQRWKWLLAGFILLVLLVQFGGPTVVVANRTPKAICEVHISASNDQTDWGPNRLRSQVPAPQSRDIHMPMYFLWFTPAESRAYHAWAVNCEGKIIEYREFTDLRETLFIWEVTGSAS